MTLPPFQTLQLSEKLQDTENEAMSKIVELEKQLMQRNKELDVVRVSVIVMTAAHGHRGEGAPAFVWPSVHVRGMHRGRLFLRRSSKEKCTVVSCTHACAIICSGQYVLVTGFRSNIFSHLDESELIMWTTHLVRNKNTACI